MGKRRTEWVARVGSAYPCFRSPRVNFVYPCHPVQSETCSPACGTVIPEALIENVGESFRDESSIVLRPCHLAGMVADRRPFLGVVGPVLDPGGQVRGASGSGSHARSVGYDHVGRCPREVHDAGQSGEHVIEYLVRRDPARACYLLENHEPDVARRQDDRWAGCCSEQTGHPS